MAKKKSKGVSESFSTLGTAAGSPPIVDLLTSLKATLKEDKACHTLEVFMYQVTMSGWDLLRPSFERWMKAKPDRTVLAYIGTGHALTDPAVLREMNALDIKVFMPRNIPGTYHPKVFYLHSGRQHFLWTGSNNLTGSGLSKNIEFSVLIQAAKPFEAFERWRKIVVQASSVATETLITSYEEERIEYAALKKAVPPFTWGEKKKVGGGRLGASPAVKKFPLGSLGIEVMKKETSNGKQIQIPLEVYTGFFKSRRKLNLRNVQTGQVKRITMSYFERSNTARIVVSELELSDRPCFLVIHPPKEGIYDFEIVKRADQRERYDALLVACNQQTRTQSKQWGIIGGARGVG
jgi:HKD family nuclease